MVFIGKIYQNKTDRHTNNINFENMEVLDTKAVFRDIWRVSFRLLGMFPYQKHKWLYYIWAVFINVSVSVITPITFICYLFFAPTWVAFLDNLKHTLAFTTCVLKRLAIWWGKTKLLETEKYFDILDKRVKRNEEEVTSVTKDVRFWTKMFRVFTAMYVICIPFYIVGALKGREKHLMFPAWYPFDLQKYFAYAFCYQVYALFIEVFANSANDCYPILYMSILRSHVSALNLRISRIGKDKSLTEKKDYEELLACIQDHIIITDILKLITPVISATTGMQIVVQAIIVCICAVVVILFPTSIAEIISTCYYTWLIVSEIIPACYVGSLLTTTFDEITTSIYNLNWIHKNHKFKRALLIFMSNTQKRQIIEAGKIFTIEVSTIISIMQFTFSLFTMLSNLS